MYLAKRRVQTLANPTGLCECGCGERTPVATTNKPARGYYIGQHVRFIPGHHIGRGEQSHSWKGGRHVHKSGYVYILMPEHPSANAHGYVFEHRLVVERRLNRLLEKKERVHHLNGIRGDNRDENLVLFSSHSEHMRDHHAHGLPQWHEARPEKSRRLKTAAGRKGADARWKKPHAVTPSRKG